MNDFEKYYAGLDEDGVPLETDSKDELYPRPMPCVRDEHGEIREQTVKALITKINEELDELKEAVFVIYQTHSLCSQYGAYKPGTQEEAIAKEAADTITAITTLCEALGIDAEMRSDAQRRVNEKNRERGRL